LSTAAQAQDKLTIAQVPGLTTDAFCITMQKGAQAAADALGAGTGVGQAGQTGKIKVVAFDAPGSNVDNTKTGLVDMAIAQHLAEIGY
jgi:ABC-type sugar transport system substrate-binding protein